MRERFWAVLGHSCWAGGSYRCCSRSSCKQAQASGISEVCRLTPTLRPVACGVSSTVHGPSAQWWGTARAGNTWLQTLGNSPVPFPLCKVQLKSPRRMINFGHCWDAERLRWAGVAGALWQGQGTGQSGLLCSHTKHSIRPLFSTLKHRRTCTWEVTQCVRCI